MNQDIKSGDLQWRTGVVLENHDAGAEALVKADKEAKTIRIYAIGEQKRNYFSVIRHTFNKLIDSFEELDARQWVPLPDNEDIDIEYIELLGYERVGKEEFFVGKLGKAYSVSRLLDGIEKPQTRLIRRMSGQKGPQGLSVFIDNKPDYNFQQEIQALSRSEAVALARAEATAKSSFQLSIHLPELQSGFDRLKDMLEDAGPDLKKRLEEIDRELYTVDGESNKKELKRPLGKLGNFLRQLGDDKSDYSKLLKGTKKAMQAAKKLGKTYNKFTGWIPGLPQIPPFLLGKDKK